MTQNYVWLYRIFSGLTVFTLVTVSFFDEIIDWNIDEIIDWKKYDKKGISVNGVGKIEDLEEEEKAIL